MSSTAVVAACVGVVAVIPAMFKLSLDVSETATTFGRRIKSVELLPENPFFQLFSIKITSRFRTLVICFVSDDNRKHSEEFLEKAEIEVGKKFNFAAFQASLMNHAKLHENESFINFRHEKVFYLFVGDLTPQDQLNIWEIAGENIEINSHFAALHPCSAGLFCDKQPKCPYHHKKVCKLGPNCNRKGRCLLSHPPLCDQGDNCKLYKSNTCLYYHPLKGDEKISPPESPRLAASQSAQPVLPHSPQLVVVTPPNSPREEEVVVQSNLDSVPPASPVVEKISIEDEAVSPVSSQEAAKPL